MGRSLLKILAGQIVMAIRSGDLATADRCLTQAKSLVSDGKIADGHMTPPGPLADDDAARDSVSTLCLIVAYARDELREECLLLDGP